MLYAVNREGNVINIVAIALEFPGQMMPFVSRGHGAVNAGVNPVAIGIAPNVPLAGGDVALRAEDPAPVSVGLVAVKFERLGVLRRSQVEIDSNQANGHRRWI